jgi:hypothetical protein
MHWCACACACVSCDLNCVAIECVWGAVSMCKHMAYVFDHFLLRVIFCEAGVFVA